MPTAIFVGGNQIGDSFWYLIRKGIAFSERLDSTVGEAKTTERTPRAPVVFSFGETMPAPTTHSTSAASSLISADEFAKLLSASTRTIRRYDSAGRVPKPLKLGGVTRWRREEIEAWIAAGCPRRSQWEWK